MNLLKQLFSLVFIAMSLTSFAQEDPKSDVSKYVECYKGTRGVTVHVTRVGLKSNNEYLVRVTNIDHEWDGRIFKCKVTNNSNKFEYSTTVDDKSITLFTRQKEKGWLYLKGETEDITVEFEGLNLNNERSEALLSEYTQQQKTINTNSKFKSKQ